MTDAQLLTILSPLPGAGDSLLQKRRRQLADPAVRARKRQELLDPPEKTLAPSSKFTLPQAVIHDPEDLRRLLRLIPETDAGNDGDDVASGARRYHCPLHRGQEPRGPASLCVSEACAPGGAALLHCFRCGQRWSALEFLVRMLPGDQAMLAATRLWPERAEAGEFTEEEFRRVSALLERNALLNGAMPNYLMAMVLGGLLPDPPFGDWGFLPHACLLEALAREDVPGTLEEDYCVFHVLRGYAGAPAALDVYTRDFRPCFRHWLGPAGVPLYASPPECDLADPALGVFLCRDATEAYARERTMLDQNPEATPRFMVACR